MTRDHDITDTAWQHELRQHYAAQDAAALAEEPTCGACGSDHIVVDGKIVCRSCEAERAQYAALAKYGW